MNSFADELLTWVRENNVQRIPKELTLNRAINAHFGGKGGKYPNGCYSGRCDVVIPTGNGRFRWIEVKYAQMYFSQTDFRRNNRSLFEKYVFSDSSKEHSVRNDFVLKLNSLIGHSAVDYVGMLVVFLYSDIYPLPNDTIERLDVIAPANKWRKHTVPAWPNPDHQERSWVLPIYWERSGG